MTTIWIITLVLLGGVLLWGICRVLAAGFAFAYFEREYADLIGIVQGKVQADRRFALTFSWFGPFALATVVFVRGFRHGWMNPWNVRP